MNVPTLANPSDKLRWSLRCRGVLVTWLTCLGRVCRFAKTEWYWRFKERAFDRRHGVDTAGLIWAEELDLDEQGKSQGWGYMATQPEWFGILLSQLQLDFRRYTFVDFGSGKGRSLLLAAEFPFRRIVGVEHSPALHRAAQQNLARWRSRTQQCFCVESQCGDAARFQLPNGPTLLYLYNPFKEEVMQAVLSNLRAAHEAAPRPLVIVYANPTCKALCDAASWLELLQDRPGHDPPLVVYAAKTAPPDPVV